MERQGSTLLGHSAFALGMALPAPKADLRQGASEKRAGGKRPSIAAVGRGAFPAALWLLAGPGCPTKISHKFM